MVLQKMINFYKGITFILTNPHGLNQKNIEELCTVQCKKFLFDISFNTELMLTDMEKEKLYFSWIKNGITCFVKIIIDLIWTFLLLVIIMVVVMLMSVLLPCPCNLVLESIICLISVWSRSIVCILCTTLKRESSSLSI